MLQVYIELNKYTQTNSNRKQNYMVKMGAKHAEICIVVFLNDI